VAVRAGYFLLFGLVCHGCLSGDGLL
jgi:hypothetical protein